MRAAKLFFVLHVVVLVFGLAGILIALPHPQLWTPYPLLRPFFTYGMAQGGASQMVLGAAAMLSFGIWSIGARKTAIFFVASAGISLCMELIGTSTGWPFGAYSYTDSLGIKVAGRVPFGVPLSWFYMGYASYLLAGALTAGRRRLLATVAVGALLLTAWDLVLDPAMASSALPVQFWVWRQTGPYFGMPIRNLIGWTITGFVFMAASRLLWREEASVPTQQVWLPFAVYAVNVGFAVALSLSVGIWPATLAAVVLGLLPAAWAWRRAAARQGPAWAPVGA